MHRPATVVPPRGLVWLALVAALATVPGQHRVALASPARTAATAPDETRALWVLRSSLTDANRINRLVRSAAESGFNTLFLQVRARGDAFYAGSREPAGDGIRRGFDPLAHAIDAARAARLRVHIWINVNLVASVLALPTDPAHIVRAHPDWLMVPRGLAVELARIPPRDPRYLAGLTRWTARHRDRVEGLFASPITPSAAKHVEALIGDLATRYDVDGVHLDYIRYPSPDFDYSVAALAAFRDSVQSSLSPEDRDRLDRRLPREPLIYADAFPQRWVAFRQLRLADLVARIRGAVGRARPQALLSAAVFPDADEAVRGRLQDWPDWARRGLIDAVCPMAYTTSLPQFRRQIDAARRVVAPQALWAGIGAYRLTPAQTVTHIAAAREAGARGVILFSYDSLADVPGRDVLGDIGRQAFAPARAAAEPRAPAHPTSRRLGPGRR